MQAHTKPLRGKNYLSLHTDGDNQVGLLKNKKMAGNKKAPGAAKLHETGFIYYNALGSSFSTNRLKNVRQISGADKQKPHLFKINH